MSAQLTLSGAKQTQPMSAQGQTLPWRPFFGHVRFTPSSDQIADKGFRQLRAQNRTLAPQQNRSLFDHLIGARQQRRRDDHAERLRGFEIDRQFEFGRLRNRQIGGLAAL